MSATNPLTVEDLWSVKRVGSPAAARDGSFLVVPVTTYDMETNESSSRLYRVDGPGSEPRPLTAEEQKSSQPALSPDGKQLAFIRQNTDKVGQLAILPLDGGEAELLTDLPLGATGPRWFADGHRIAFLATLFRDAMTVEGTRELKEEREKDKVKAYATETCLARYWDSWITDGRVTHIFVYDLNSREITDVTPQFTGWFDPDGAEGEFDISPDGGEIAFSADRSEPPHQHLNWNVFVVDLAERKPESITSQFVGHQNRPRYSPDGKHLVYGMQRIPEFYADKVRLVRYDRADATHTVLTEDWDRSAAGWEFSDDGRLVLKAEDEASHAIYRAGLEPGEPKRLCGGGNYQAVTPVSGGDIISVWDDNAHPAEVVRLSGDGTHTEFWTAMNREWGQRISWGTCRSKKIAGADGKPLQYYEVLPPGFTPERKWPMILAIHGGPHGIWGDNFHFRWNMQLFAAAGYVVVAPNPHGSTSFGQDYADAIQGGWGDKPYRDLMAVTDDMEKSGYVDKKRIAAAGGSYGGYMVAWIAGQTDRFACLVNHAGVSNLLSEYASDVFDGWGRALGGEPWDGIENIDAMNPVRFAAGFRSPMLVIHGEKDYRVPVTQGLEIYNIYQAKGLPARLVVFPDENHWILKPQNSRRWFGEYFGWLERWMGKPGPLA